MVVQANIALLPAADLLTAPRLCISFKCPQKEFVLEYITLTQSVTIECSYGKLGLNELSFRISKTNIGPISYPLQQLLHGLCGSTADHDQSGSNTFPANPL